MKKIGFIESWRFSVIHDDDAKEHKMLMKVISIKQD